MRVFILVAIFVSNAACSQPQLVQSQFDVISIQTTSCLGSCPAYSLYLFSDGQYIFDGMANTETEGVQRGYLEAGVFAEALELLNQSEFRTFLQGYVWGDDTCPNWHTDDTTTTLLAEGGGERWSLTWYHGCRGFNRESEIETLVANLKRLLIDDQFLSSTSN
jgi:hypothetical protein